MRKAIGFTELPRRVLVRLALFYKYRIIFSCACWLPMCILQGKYLFRSPIYCSFFIRLFVLLILDCRSCLSTLDINLLSAASLANIFFQSTGCLLVLFMVPFAV